MQKNGHLRKRPRGEEEVIDVDALDEITPVRRAPATAPPASRQPPQSSGSLLTQSAQDVEAEELSNPSVSIVDLFRRYNQQYFWGSLHGVFVEFSKRMTSCAGTCTFRGKLGGCRIALSEPLLKFRPRSDLLSTLLHEMIHAFLFMTEGIAARDGHDGHGPKFLSHAARINMAEGGRVNITPYHSFIDEVELYRVHHWQCNKCSRLIKRAMNRAPAPRDPWWPRHQMACGGDFIKVKEPEKKKKWKRPKKFFGAYGVDPNDKSAPPPPPGVMLTQRVEDILCVKPKTVACPVCGTQIVERLMNQHLDECLSPNLFSQDPAQAGHSENQADDGEKLPEERTVVPLSGQLFRERNFGVGLTNRSSASAGPSSRPNGEGRKLGSSGDGGGGTGNGELNSKPNLALPPNVRAHFKAESIDQTSVASALQVLFGGADALMGYAIGGEPIVPFKPIVSSGFNKPRSLFGLLSEAANGEKEIPIKPLSVGETPQQVIEEVQARFDISGYGLTNADIPSSPRRFSKMEAIGRARTNSDTTERLSAWDKSEIVNGSVRKKSKRVRQWQTAGEGVPASKTYANPSSFGSTPATVPAPISPVRNLKHSFWPPAETKAAPSLANPVRASVTEGATTQTMTSGGSSSMVNTASGGVMKQSKTSACPLCDTTVLQTELESHVSLCLAQTEFEPELASVDTPVVPETSNNGEGRCVQSVSGLISSHFQNPNPPKGTGPCPICDSQVVREDLESHITICMTSTGIMDAFS